MILHSHVVSFVGFSQEKKGEKLGKGQKLTDTYQQHEIQPCLTSQIYKHLIFHITQIDNLIACCHC